MLTCDRCGHEAGGAFCGNCGASMRGGDDATQTASTRASNSHREGWQDEPTYTGAYGSYPSYGSGNPSQGGYSSGPYGAAPQSPRDNSRRNNQLLATLVGVAAVAVIALVAYLIFRPDGGGNSTTAVPSVTGSSSTSSSSSTTSTPSTTTTTQNQENPEPRTVTQTQQGGGGGAVGGGGSDGGDTRDGYTFQQSGNSVTITDASGAQVGDLHLNGYRSDWAQGQKLSWISLSGCAAPILVWNAGGGNASGAFGLNSSGQYSMFQSTGSDLSPIGGSGSAASSYGVYDKSDHISYRDSKSVKEHHYNTFYGCTANGQDLAFSGQGD